MTEHVGKQQQQESSSNNNNTSETCTTPSTINIPKSQPEISTTATVVSDASISNTEETAQNLVVSAAPSDLTTTDENITEATNPSSVENTNNSSVNLVISETQNAPMEPENTQSETETTPVVTTEIAPTSVEVLSKDAEAKDSRAMDVDPPSTITASAAPSSNLVETNQFSSVETTVTTTPSIPVSSNVPSTTINTSTCNNIPSTTVQASETVHSVTTSSIMYSEPATTTVVTNSVQETTETQQPMEEEVDHTQTFIVSHPESETQGEKTVPYSNRPIVLQPTRLIEKSAVDQSATTRLVEQQRAVLAQTTTQTSSVQHQPVIATSSRPLAVKTVPMHPEFIGPGSTVIIHEDNVISIPEDGKTANNVISIPEDFQSKEDLASLVDEGSMVHNLKLEDQTGARIQVSQGYHLNIPTHLTLASGNTVLINQQQHNSNILAAAMAGNNISTTTSGLDLGQMRLQEQKVKVEPTSLGMLKAPSTDVLLKTAKEVLQLQDDDPPQYRRVFHTQG